ncbi:DNA polymerase Y family protein [Chelatococcus sp. SYSU_G07232]|uniref:DNA-directed DNA polymerase n=1 Tax=Chelatococcus albus TaxID=3047466 RepID=A0ABT7AHX6_9HYPH|nr:DUF6504 family protein [Chelatococcus sp. SYSU_G07232]MDJ1158968.1 DNA polymerase Y family protein [Chelatococcus sp. SYSU_G07232]
MPRIVSVWFPRWPITRFLQAQARVPPRDRRDPVDPALPFILSVEGSGGPRIAAVNAAGAALRLAVGDTLADARAKAGGLQVRPADPAADDAALNRLARWATRYTPSVAPWNEENGADGLFLDVTGATHLLGGEAGLLADLARRLARFGLPARLALAGTPGAAWAVAHYGGGAEGAGADAASPGVIVPSMIVPSGAEARALAPLPIAALRLPPAMCTTLRRLGVKRVADLMRNPRAPFATRFGKELLARLDRALGYLPEPISPLGPEPAYGACRQLLEPIGTKDAVATVAEDLMGDLAPQLARDGVGARMLALTLYRVDGGTFTLDIGLAAATRDPRHVARLAALRLDAAAETVDAGFGFETIRLDATAVEPVPELSRALVATGDRTAMRERHTRLVDALRQRLGPGSVRRLWPVESFVPERAVRARPAGGEAPAWPRPRTDRARPLLLLPRAEPAEVLALVPEGPPRRFRWRGVSHRVAGVQGPERIAAEWWHAPGATRDYYVVEDEAGRRFWLYREGLYGRETDAPRWFVHGLFG